MEITLNGKLREVAVATTVTRLLKELKLHQLRVAVQVNLDIIAEPKRLPWSRSLFNGLAQIIVQSTRDAGEIKLTATADGLTPATTVGKTQPCVPRPSMP